MLFDVLCARTRTSHVYSSKVPRQRASVSKCEQVLSDGLVILTVSLNMPDNNIGVLAPPTPWALPLPGRSCWHYCSASLQPAPRDWHHRHAGWCCRRSEPLLLAVAKHPRAPFPSSSSRWHFPACWQSPVSWYIPSSKVCCVPAIIAGVHITVAYQSTSRGQRTRVRSSAGSTVESACDCSCTCQLISSNLERSIRLARSTPLD